MKSSNVKLLGPGSPAMVDFHNVTKTFGEGDNQKIALQNVSFKVRDLPDKGELVTIVGRSGCGKSTLLRILAGLPPHYPATSGEIHVFGNPLKEAQADTDRGLVDQKYSLLPHLTVVENIAFGLRLQGMGRREREAIAMEWVGKVGLSGSEKKYPSQLSGGMQQRVSIASTLILHPRMILMDEPFGALDPKTRMDMQQLLVNLWNELNATVFFVTHQMDEAIYLGDRIFRMGTNPGRLIEVLKVPRPDVHPELFRKEKWFFAAVEELAKRLETDAPAKINDDWETLVPESIIKD
jgi:NitT/TauT family transport system ATP-binding protein